MGANAPAPEHMQEGGDSERALGLVGLHWPSADPPAPIMDEAAWWEHAAAGTVGGREGSSPAQQVPVGEMAVLAGSNPALVHSTIQEAWQEWTTSVESRGIAGAASSLASRILDVPSTAASATTRPDASAAGSWQLTEAEMRSLLVSVNCLGQCQEDAIAVSWCESRHSVEAVGASGEMGLWQIHPQWHPDATTDPEGNARAMMRISAGGTNWWAWSCKP